MLTAKSTRVSVLLPSYLVAEIKKISEKDEVTQSNIVKRALDAWLKKRLTEDAKTLSKMVFDDLPSENEWVGIQSFV